MTQLKYGRRSPSNKPAIHLADVLTGVLPWVPSAADYLISLGGWKMLGNDQYGDCVAVTWANTRRLVTAAIGGAEVYPNISEVEALYETQNPGFPSQDNGMDIQTCLGTLHKGGGPDGVKAVAYAKVDHTNPSEVKAAIAIFGSVWTGINVLRANMEEFNAGEPWDTSIGPIDGGHSVIVGGYGTPGAGPLGGDERFITWAQETSFTDAFWQYQVEECWVVIWPEHLGSKAFMEGVDQAALAAAYTALTGQPFPVQPTPPPEPTPTPPAPVPPAPGSDADVALVAAQQAWEAHEDNMRSMRSCDKTLEAAQRAWRAAKGL